MKNISKHIIYLLKKCLLFVMINLAAAALICLIIRNGFKSYCNVLNYIAIGYFVFSLFCLSGLNNAGGLSYIETLSTNADYMDEMRKSRRVNLPLSIYLIVISVVTFVVSLIISLVL